MVPCLNRCQRALAAALALLSRLRTVLVEGAMIDNEGCHKEPPEAHRGTQSRWDAEDLEDKVHKGQKRCNARACPSRTEAQCTATSKPDLVQVDEKHNARQQLAKRPRNKAIAKPAGEPAKVKSSHGRGG